MRTRHFPSFVLLILLTLTLPLSGHATSSFSTHMPLIQARVAAQTPASDPILIYSLYYDTYLAGEPDEAFALINVSATPVDITSWQVTDGEGTVTFPAYTIAPGQIVWASRTATRFREEFGFAPDLEYGSDSDPTVPDMTGSAPTFANSGDEIRLLDVTGVTIDALVYEGGDTTTPGWSGPAVYPYTQGYFGEEGQLLYRKLDETTGLPVPDTNTAADWAQTRDDDIAGKKVRWPGWDLERYFMPLKTTQSARLVYLIAPDNIYDAYVTELNQATQYVYIETYSFKNAHIADLLVDKLQQGVQVKVLLEEEVVNGISDQEKWICQQLEANGGECWFMYNDESADVHDRYNFQHAKFTIVDGQVLLTGSENLNGSSMPADDKSDGTWGNRGTYIITDAPALVNHALDIFQHDLDPANHKDIRRWDPVADAPPSGFVPDYTTGGAGYDVQFPTPLELNGTFDFEVVQAPENALRASDALLGLVARAGAGGVVLVEQLYERKYWGPVTSDPTTDPNPRLEAYIDAARRGAKVRMLLDSYYDDPTDPRWNGATCAYVNNIAATDGLDLECRQGNPTGTGIHNKMVLVWDGTHGWTHTGSINGSENSSKNNRELAIQVRSTDGYNYLASMFEHDWIASGGSPIFPTPTPTPTFTPTYTPTWTPTPTSTPTPTATATPTPSGTGYLLITEVFYDTPGTDADEEWVEIYNPTAATVDLSLYKIGDEESQGGREGMYRFPAGARIAPGQKVVVALKATGFRTLYGFNPDYEIVDTDPAVPDMTSYSVWASGRMALANTGDEVLLLDGHDVAVDVVTYESGSYPGVVPHPGVTTGHSIERQPSDQDTNDCSLDFVDRPSPTPGR